jgi:DNA polymerase-1
MQVFFQIFFSYTCSMDFEIIRTNRGALLVARDLKRCSSIAWDTETFGDAPESFDWVRGKQAWHQYSDGKRAWLIDCTKVDIQIFKAVLEDPDIEKIIHNSAFDAAWTKREHKINVRNITDTRYQEQMILGIALPRDLRKAEKERYEPLYSASLKWCFHRRGWDDKMVFEPFYKGVPLTPTQPLYMVRDVDQLHELAEDQQQKIDAMGLQNVQTLESEICEVTVEMMNNGFGVDEAGWLALAKKEERITRRCEKTLKQFADINWGSWAQYCKFFGVNRTGDLEGYEYRTDKTKKQQEAYKIFIELRDGHYKNVSTYGKSWLEQHVHNGLVRCQYTQMVNTARFSCDKPNMQNIPSTTEHRSFFIPGHGKNNVFIAADFSSQELAIIAVGSQEPSWLSCLRSGGDLHSMVARDIVTGWEQLNSEEQKNQRKIVKIINFSIAYGAGTTTIAQRAGVDEHTILLRLNTMKRKYPALFRWLDKNGVEAKRTWESRSFPPFNRYRSLAMETESWRRVNIGKNNPVQMTAADLSKLAMYLMWQEIKSGLKAKFIHMLHDELIIECNKKDSKKVADVLSDSMNRACIEILGEPLTKPDIKIQPNWSK